MLIPSIRTPLFIAVLCMLCACLSSASGDQIINHSKANSNVEKNQIPLQLKLELRYSLSHGWGYVYVGKVKEVLIGNFKDPVINLHLSVSDFEEKFSHIVSDTSENQVVAEFVRIKNDKPYVNGQNAFIDEEGRTWEVINIWTVEKK